MKIAVTGHRPDKLRGYDEPEKHVKSYIKSIVSKLEPEVFITGMALGVDTWAAEACIEIGVDILAAIPYESQAGWWQPEDKRRYSDILEYAKDIEIVSADPKGRIDAIKALQRRNEWMVDHADLVVAVWDGKKGGTRNCVNYARKVGKDIIHIDPKDWSINRFQYEASGQ